MSARSQNDNWIISFIQQRYWEVLVPTKESPSLPKHLKGNPSISNEEVYVFANPSILPDSLQCTHVIAIVLENNCFILKRKFITAYLKNMIAVFNKNKTPHLYLNAIVWSLFLYFDFIFITQIAGWYELKWIWKKSKILI